MNEQKRGMRFSINKTNPYTVIIIVLLEITNQHFWREIYHYFLFQKISCVQIRVIAQAHKQLTRNYLLQSHCTIVECKHSSKLNF